MSEDLILFRLQVVSSTCSVKDHGLFPFQNLQVKTFERSCYFSYVWVKMVKKVINTSLTSFDDFAGHLHGLC